jgi:hypothetical protein
MQESFIQFLWQYQLFTKNNLYTEEGQPLRIIRTGKLNTNAGPDFSEARILIGDMEWSGQVEIHIKGSDWFRHRHQKDAVYDTVILHVVWQHDSPVYRTNGTPIPTLCLQPYTLASTLDRYQLLTTNTACIPCAGQFNSVPDLYRRQALDQAIMQRLQNKSRLVLELLHANRSDWEETTYQLLAQNLGMKTNASPFLRLAKATPLKLLRKHGDSLAQMEALLFGQAGLLEGQFCDHYPSELKQEYQFLCHKYQLETSRLSSTEWKWARLRPGNFPEIRIAQLAALVHAHKSLFSYFLLMGPEADTNTLPHCAASPYWTKHYRFDKLSGDIHAGLGDTSRENIIINTKVPLLAAWAEVKEEDAHYYHAVRLLESLPAEENKITRKWRSLGLAATNAYDSQGCIELYNHFCSERQCLRCPAGFFLLKNSQQSHPIQT